MTEVIPVKSKSFKDNIFRYTELIFIVIMCVATAILQAQGFLTLDHYTQMFSIAMAFLVFIAWLSYKAYFGLNDERTRIRLIVMAGTLLRCAYVLITGLYERQHDAGVYTGKATDFVNFGHIGYVEYIYKFNSIPQIDPYTVFGYYHPPFHHIIEALWLKFNVFLGVSEDLAFENLQIPTLLYSCLIMLVTYSILKVLKINGKGMTVGMCLIAFHPATIIMSGSVNNDVLTMLFMSLIMLLALMYIREKNLMTLILIALCIGFGMLTKLNAAVLAVPVGIIFLMHFISVIKSKDKESIVKWIKNYAIFAVLVIPIGMAWIIRNEIRFSKHPAVPVPGEASPLYTQSYSLWSRLGIPSLSQWHFDFPFHPLKAAACNNTWAIMFHTAIYAEEYPVDITDPMLILCQITFILQIVLAILAIYLLIKVCLDKRTALEDKVFLLVGYVAIICAFIAFVLIYPYTCSSDFRYISICLIYTIIAIGLANKYNYKRIALYNGGILSFLGMIQVIYLLWW